MLNYLNNNLVLINHIYMLLNYFTTFDCRNMRIYKKIQKLQENESCKKPLNTREYDDLRR